MPLETNPTIFSIAKEIRGGDTPPICIYYNPEWVQTISGSVTKRMATSESAMNKIWGIPAYIDETIDTYKVVYEE